MRMQDIDVPKNRNDRPAAAMKSIYCYVGNSSKPDISFERTNNEN